VIPFEDPTILFVNAGMNQFKDVFAGRRRVEYTRAVSSQKCLRAGGKHNDLDCVGFSGHHHTFFEMLGNFSFGDYYKEEAIAYAWEWVTEYLKLPVERLYATVYETDDDAFALWEKIAPPLKDGRILRFGKKDNFWSMGDIGPCGPCSEIHFDRGGEFGSGPNDVVNGDTERFVEIWNLVFMQDDQLPDGRVVPLPKPSVDTGAGLERLTAVIQGAESNYAIDVFQGLIAAVSELTGRKYADHVTSHQVLADHVRALTFALADGAGISNEGRGYVLRRILRRAARHARLLGAEEPMLYKLVPVVAEQMGDVYPEVAEKQQHVANVIKAEEEAFGRTLETGLSHFDRLARKIRSDRRTEIDGEEAFRLYDTYGFPYDLTEIIAAEHGFTVDHEGFEEALARQQEQSRAGNAQAADFVKVELPSSEWVRLSYEELRKPFKTKVLARHLDAAEGAPYLVLEKTPAYVEAGGQVADTGRVVNEDFEFTITDSQYQGGSIVLIGSVVRGSVEEGDAVEVHIDVDRRLDIMRNHTATHLAHAALREVLGEHVRQSGSYVGPDRLRFDFSHHQPMTPAEIMRVEEIVNEMILRGEAVKTEMMDAESARKSGAMALFGEKYGDTVRVVSVGSFSKELCGGTHLDNVAIIGPFMVTMETGIASGVRRLEAVTGREAARLMLEARNFQQQTAQMVGRPLEEALDGLKRLRDDHAALQKELKKTREAMFAGGGATTGTESRIGELTLFTHDFGDTDKDTMGAWLDSHKSSPQAVVAAALGIVGDKLTFMAAASQAAVKGHKVHAGKLTGELLAAFGGRGGGKPAFAQGGVATRIDTNDLFGKLQALLQAKG
jgi:alanyl-tRNA synthetase